MQKYIFSFFISILIIISSTYCSNSSSADNQDTAEWPVEGFVQKGPFIQGSEIFIQEVDRNLVPSGKIYVMETTNDSGSFTLDSYSHSRYLDIKTTGFYFNETTGSLSGTSITLNAMVDSSENQKININVLTTLAYDRIKYLTQNKKISFHAAEEQAESEVLKIFNIDINSLKTRPSDFSQMDISKEGASNAILLAASSILQWGNAEGELSELIAHISSDIKTDGTLDNETYISELKNNSVSLDPGAIRNNITARYNYLGIPLSIPDFEDFIDRDGDGMLKTKEPAFTPAGGVYNHNISVTLSSVYNNGIIYYTTDGSEPADSSDKYSGPIQISGNGTIATIKAFAVKQGLAPSNVVTAVYSIQYQANVKTVYAGGYYYNGKKAGSTDVTIPCYWTDTARTDLPTGQWQNSPSDPPDIFRGWVNSIFVDKGIVYTGGYYHHNYNSYRPCYWTGTLITELSNSDAAINSIYVYGGTVHSGGYKMAAGSACYWKGSTGTGVDLAGGYQNQGMVTSIFVSGGTVYCGGTIPGNAGYWVNNGPFVPLEAKGYVSSIYIYDGKVYAGGYSTRPQDKACYWISTPTGTAWTALSDSVSRVNSIFVYKGTVYSAGSDSGIPCYWKGTARTDLTDGSYAADAVSIYVSGGIVYIGGSYYDGTRRVPCYWEETARTSLPGDGTHDGYVTSIFVE